MDCKEVRIEKNSERYKLVGNTSFITEFEINIL